MQWFCNKASQIPERYSVQMQAVTRPKKLVMLGQIDQVYLSMIECPKHDWRVSICHKGLCYNRNNCLVPTLFLLYFCTCEIGWYFYMPLMLKFWNFQAWETWIWIRTLKNFLIPEYHPNCPMSHWDLSMWYFHVGNYWIEKSAVLFKWEPLFSSFLPKRIICCLEFRFFAARKPNKNPFHLIRMLLS